MPVLGSCSELVPCDFQLFLHGRESQSFCCNLISLLSTSPFGGWQELWSVWSRRVSHPQAAPTGVTLSHQEEKLISWQPALPGYLVSQSGSLGRKLGVFVSQDIHRRWHLVPEREPLSLLSTPQSQVKSHKGNHILARRAAGWNSHGCNAEFSLPTEASC